MLIYALQTFTATDGTVCTARNTYTLTDAAGQSAIMNGNAQRAEMPNYFATPYLSEDKSGNTNGLGDPVSGARYAISKQERASSLPHYNIGDARLVDTVNIDGQAYSSSGYNNYCVIPTVLKNYQGLPGTAGTGAIVEPSMLYFTQGWNGWEYWLAAMPYDSSNAQYENPCIFCSHDGKNWTIPTGGSNPLVLPPNATDHNFDNTLFMAEDGVTMCIAYGQTAGANSGLWYITSVDGVNWSSPVAMSGTNFATSTHYLNTPCPVYDAAAGQWTMYSVDTPGSVSAGIVYQTSTSLAGPWSAPSAVTGDLPSGETVVWHIDLKRLPGNELVGLAQTGGNSGGRCYPIRIRPSGTGFGTNCEYGPVLRPNNFRTNATYMYRCTAVPVGDKWQALFGTIGVGPYGGFALIPGTVSFDSSDYFNAFYGRNGALMPNAQLTGTLATVASYSGGLFWDSFNHATLGNCTASGNGSATAWTISGTGTLAISANKMMQTVAGANHAYVNTGSADVDMQIALSALGSSFYVTFRLADTNNFWRVFVATGQLYLMKIVGGAVTNIASSIVTVSDLPGTIRVVAKGNSIKVYFKDLLIFNINSGYLNTATNHGVQFGSDAVTAVSNVLMALPR